MATWVAVVVALIISGCVGAQQIKPDDPVGTSGLKPTQEDKDAGIVGVRPGFDVKAFRVVAVDRFTVSESEIKDEGDRRFAQELSTFLQSELVRRLRDTGLFDTVVNLTETEFRPATARALRIQGTITRLGRGSQALRAMWGLYGAGRTRAQAEMHFIEVQSGEIVMVTADRRIASVGVWGGDDRGHLKESFDDMARDLAKFLVRLAKGEAPRS